MNRGAIAEIAAIDPAAVVVKGDLTATGTTRSTSGSSTFYAPRSANAAPRPRQPRRVLRRRRSPPTRRSWSTCPACTARGARHRDPRHPRPDRCTAEQLEWLDDLARRGSATRPVLVFGHHHVWSPGRRSARDALLRHQPRRLRAARSRSSRAPAIVRGYFAGHTHRNRVRRFPATGDVPWVEVACVKDFPGAWAEYRVFEGGVLQVHRRISHARGPGVDREDPRHVRRRLPDYAFGTLDDRNFIVC